MKLLSAQFIGLKGIYSKSQIRKVHIDFTKSMHNIIFIIGKNGSGKSTIMDALHPLPDPAQMYLDNEEGSKELIYDDNGTLYKIYIKYPVNNQGARLQTKAFISQLGMNGAEIELNPNGNIGSFKDVIHSRFNLDPNFVSLSQLSVENRGLVDKKPSERKKFVANILEYVEVYNDIYKAVSKRASIFKSMQNSIVAKIDSIGDEEKLNIELRSLSSRRQSLLAERDTCVAELSKNNAMISLIDPDGSIQKLYDDLQNQYSQLLYKQTLYTPKDTNLDLSKQIALYKTLKDTRDSIALKIDSITSDINSIFLKREDEAKVISTKQQRIISLNIVEDASLIESRISVYKNQIQQYEDLFKNIGLSSMSITKDEYVTGLNTLKDFRECILNIKSYASNEALQQAVEYIRIGESPIKDLNIMTTNLDKINTDISESNGKLQYYEGLLTKLDILKSRPAKCTVNSCIFIKDALAAQAKHPEIEISKLATSISKLETLRKTQEQRLTLQNEVVQVYNDLIVLVRNISMNSSILNKLPNGTIFTNTKVLFARIVNGDTFNDIYDLYNEIDKANLLEVYHNIKNTLPALESEYLIIKEKEKLIEELQLDLDELTKNLKKIDEQISEKVEYRDSLEKKKVMLEDDLKQADADLQKLLTLNDINRELDDIRAKMKTVSSNINKISAAIQAANAITTKITAIDKDLQPISKSIDNINFSLAKLQEYKKELELYTSKSEIVELIKKYTTPTKSGIQTVFMQLYMGKTLSMANELLSLLFDGQLELLPYVINDSEFRIPCINKNTLVTNDDISSCSTAERSMISMILSFALLYQSSTKYNILKLDEIDGSLDQDNKSNFVKILSQIMDILSVEQCIIVSHSSEIDLSEVDVISLTPVGNEPINGNVIFQL